MEHMTSGQHQGAYRALLNDRRMLKARLASLGEQEHGKRRELQREMDAIEAATKRFDANAEANGMAPINNG